MTFQEGEKRVKRQEESETGCEGIGYVFIPGEVLLSKLSGLRQMHQELEDL